MEWKMWCVFVCVRASASVCVRIQTSLPLTKWYWNVLFVLLSGRVLLVDLRLGCQKMRGATQPVNFCLFSLKNHRKKIYPWRSAWCSWPIRNLLFFRAFPKAASCWSTYSFPHPPITVSTVLGPHKHSLITAATLSSKAESEKNRAWYLGINKQMMAGKQKQNQNPKNTR